MSNISPAIAGLAILVSIGAVQAQGFGGSGPNSIPENINPAMCDQMARIPNPPISVEACRSMMGMAKGYEAAASDPGASRPGDEAMSCEQIFAELMTMDGVGISAETAAQAQVASKEGVALAQRQAAEGAAFAAKMQAMGLAAGVAGAFAPNIAGAAAGAIMQQQSMAFAAKQQADAAPVRAQMNQALTATTGELGQQIQANPRLGRLMQLAMRNNCEAPAGAQ